MTPDTALTITGTTTDATTVTTTITTTITTGTLTARPGGIVFAISPSR